MVWSLISSPPRVREGQGYQMDTIFILSVLKLYRAVQSMSAPLPKEAGMSSRTDDLDLNWAVHEFAEADLGDMRRTKHIVELAKVLAQPDAPTARSLWRWGHAQRPIVSLRMTTSPATASPAILSRPTGADRVPVVLAVQDTTEVNWTSHPTTGLGPWAIRPVELHVHSTLAFTRIASVGTVRATRVGTRSR
jgi:hypothetical protein